MGSLVIILAVLLTFVAVTVVFNILNTREDQRLRRLAEERQGETICHFVRTLDYRRLDTKIIRAVYEGLQEGYLGPGFPVRASDDLDQTYRIDSEDLVDLVTKIADQCGRWSEGYERNPYYGKVTTVSNLIEFLCAQPKAQVP